MCSCLGGRCNWCLRWRWPAPLLWPLSTTERNNDDECVGNGDYGEWSGAASVHRHELCRRVDEAVSFGPFILSFLVFIFTYVNVGSSTQKSDLDLTKHDSISRNSSILKIYSEMSSSTRRKEKACAHKLWNLRFVHCACVPVPVDVYVR